MLRSSSVRRFTVAIWLVAAAAIGSTGSAADPYPTRPITIVVPFAAGAANDVLARTIGGELKERLGPVVVENKPGANGNIGAQLVKSAPPDGHTIMVAPNQFTINAVLSPKSSIDFVRDFEPIILTNLLPFFLIVNHEVLPIDSASALVSYVRNHPGKLSYGSAGTASPHRLAMELFKLKAGLDVVHVPYKGMAQGLPDLLTGRIQMLITGYPAVANYMKTGKLKVLAVAGKTRSALLPEVPTMAEAGIAGVEITTWLGFLAPTGTPRPVIDRLNDAINDALRVPSVRETLARQGMDFVGGTPAAFRDVIAADIAQVRGIANGAGITAE